MQPFENEHGELLVPPDVPEEIRIVFYNLHTLGRRQKKAVPAVTVALTVHVNGEVMSRGITICSPDDYGMGCHCKKEGRIRAAGRAVRAYKKGNSGNYFKHPNALYVLREIFSTGLYDEFIWSNENDILSALNFEYMPIITTGEQTLIESKGF